MLGILTMAMSILLISGGIDLSIGNIMVVCGVVMYVVLDNGLPTFIAVLAGLVTGAACGLLNGAIIAKVSAFRWSLHWAPVRCFMALP